MFLIGAIWIICGRKKNTKKNEELVVVDNRAASIKNEPPATTNEIEQAERENLLNYKVEGGVELDEVLSISPPTINAQLLNFFCFISLFFVVFCLLFNH